MISDHELILEGNVVDIDGTYESRIGIDNGIITEINPQAKGQKILHLERELLFPGFIDVHVHPRVPGHEHKEDFPHLSRAALHGGITTALAMPNTEPPIATPEVLQYVIQRASKESLIDIYFFELVTENNFHVLNLAEKDSIGYKIYLGMTTGGYILPFTYFRPALNNIYASRKPTTVHCDANQVRDVLEQLRTFDKINIAHVPTKEDLKAVKEYKKKGYKISCEVTPHHALLTSNDGNRLGGFGKMLPPLQTEEDRLYLIDGMRNGDVDFYATDHAPHTKEEKQSDKPPSGVPGDDTYGNTVALLIKEYGLSAQCMMKLTSYNAARFFGLTDRGMIQEGKRADITILDLNHPAEVTSERLYTKCKWSPFEGMIFPGQVMHTIKNGKIVSNYDEVLV